MGTVLISGVAGFLGRYIARDFASKGHRVIGVDGSSPENAPLADLAAYHSLRLPNPGLGPILAELQPEVFVHCAGRASVGLSISNPEADFSVNVGITFDVLSTIRKNAPNCRFVFLSSAAVYGNPATLPIREDDPLNPVSPYGFHKWQGELLCREFSEVFGVPTAALRIFSAYGVGLRRQVVWDLCRNLLTRPSLTIQGTGNESRDFIHASDVAQAVEVIAFRAPMKGESYNVATGHEVSIAELSTQLMNVLELKRPVDFDQVVPAGTPRNWRADVTRLEALGFRPAVSFENGIRSFAPWCRAELGLIPGASRTDVS